MKTKHFYIIHGSNEKVLRETKINEIGKMKVEHINICGFVVKYMLKGKSVALNTRKEEKS